MDEWFNSFSKGIYLHNLCRTMTLWRERERERERERVAGDGRVLHVMKAKA